MLPIARNYTLDVFEPDTPDSARCSRWTWARKELIECSTRFAGMNLHRANVPSSRRDSLRFDVVRSRWRSDRLCAVRREKLVDCEISKPLKPDFPSSTVVVRININRVTLIIILVRSQTLRNIQSALLYVIRIIVAVTGSLYSKSFGPELAVTETTSARTDAAGPVVTRSHRPENYILRL